MATDDRERQFERALARHLRDYSENSGCPDPEVLAAYHERSLSLDEMARWKEHIVSCTRCQETLALVENSEHVHAEDWQNENVLAPELTIPVAACSAAAQPGKVSAGLSGDRAPKVLQRSKAKARRVGQSLRWAVPLGGLAAAVIIWVAIHERDSQRMRLDESVQVAKNQAAPRAVPASPPEVAPQNRAGSPPTKALNEETAAKKVAPPSQVMNSPRGDMSANLSSKQKEGQLDRKENREKDIGGNAAAENIGSNKSRQQVSNEVAQGAVPRAPVPSAGMAGGVGIQDEKKQGNKIATESQNAARMGLQKHSDQLYRNQIVADRGRLVGQVTDTSGAAVGGTNVRLLDDRGATVATTEADRNGNYSFSSVTPGQYELEFQQTGFKRNLIEQLNLTPGENRVDGQLQVGAATQTVVVEAAAPAVNSESANLSSTSQETSVVSGLAVQQRNFQKLIMNDHRYIVAPGDREAWRVGDQGIISRTTNSGKTWKAQDSGVKADLSAGSAPSGKVCWVVGKSGMVLLTTDGGRHWRHVVSPTTEDLGNVIATDALNAKVAVASGQTAFKTSDGGQSWVAANP